MPTFEFTSPEGKSYEIEGPEGSTKEQAFEILQKQLNVKDTAPETTDKKGGYSLKKFGEQATALPRAAATGLLKYTGQLMSGEPTEPVSKPIGERAQEAGVSAGIGAGVAYGLPKLMQAVPYAPIKAMGAGMQAASPTIARMMGGAVGGGLSSAVQQTGEEYGAPEAVKLPAAFISASLGDILGKKLTSSTMSLLSAGKSLISGDTLMAAKKLSGVMGQSPEEKARQATLKQQELFGKPSGEVPGEPTKKFTEQTQKELSDLAEQKYNIKINPNEPVSPKLREKFYSEVNNVINKDLTNQQLQQVEIDKLKNKLKSTKVVEQAPIKKQIAELESKVTSNLFSKSPEFNELKTRLDILKEKKDITSSDYDDLITRIKTDTSKNPNVRKEYGNTIDNIIREWQGALDKEGKASLNPAIQNDVRSTLRSAFNQWSENVGIGSIEKDYRSAFRAEKIAEAKDYLPYVFSEYGKSPDATKIAKQLLKDPTSKEIIQQTFKKTIADLPIEKLPTQFNRLKNLATDAGLITPTEAFKLQGLVDQITALKDKGGNVVPLLQRLRNQLIRSGVTAGTVSQAGPIFKGEE